MIDIRACDGLIEIGRQRENDYRRVLFNMGDVLGQYPDATFVVLNRRSADMTAYAVPVSQISVEGTDVCWVLKASDLAYIGDGECEVVAYSGNTVAKNEIYTVRVLAALDDGMDPPDPSWEEYLADLSAIADRAETAETGAAADALKAEGYAIGRQNGEPVDQESPYYHGHAAYFAGEAGVSAATAAGSAGEAAGSASAAGRSAGSAAGSAAAAETAQIKAETAQDAAEAAQAAAESARDQITGMTAEATTLDPGESATASYSDGVLSLGIPRGADGQDGRDGTDGISPTASVSKSGTTATITITDKTGTTTAEISDGEDGQDGAPGQDGYTPQRGTDYWTAADKAEIVAEAEAEFSEDIADIVADVSHLKDDLNAKAPVILQTASGDIVTVTDGADGMPLSSCVVSIDPVQSGSGDPAPDNVRPITGWTGANVSRMGVNLFDKSATRNVLDMYIDTSGRTRNAVSGEESIVTGRLNAGTYTISKISTSRFRIAWFETVPTTDYTQSAGFVTPVTMTVTNYTFTISKPYYIVVFCYNGSSESVTFQSVLDSFQIEPGSTASDYTPYIGSVYPISWQTAAGTVYGGNLDTRTGVLTVDRANVDLGSLNWSISGNRARSGDIASSVKLVSASVTPNAIASKYKVVSANATLSVGEFAISDTGTLIFYYDGESPTGQLVYELATPQTYQLDPVQIATLLGENNIWSNTGAVALTYPADTKLYIQQLTKPTEDDMTANTAITSGKFFMVGNRLFLATAAIAVGATIIPGTNCTELSLADALNNINA